MAKITLRQLLDHAAEYGYGVPAFNINNMEQLLAIMEAAKQVDAPVILHIAKGVAERKHGIDLGCPDLTEGQHFRLIMDDTPDVKAGRESDDLQEHNYHFQDRMPQIKMTPDPQFS